MTLQILDVVLFGYNGMVRTVSFATGRVNIITGASQTGKSALVDIIDYCLGSAECRIAEGPIRNSVSWYGLRLQTDISQIFIARRRPEIGHNSSTDIYLEVANSVQVPDVDVLERNTSVDGLVSYLTQVMGISPNRTEPLLQHTRLPFEATFRHTMFYLFQPQSLIANRQALFYRQSEPYREQTIKDSLPYFLGAVQEDRLAKREQLRRARRNLRLIERQVQEAEDIRGRDSSKAISIAAEAQQYGLLDDDPLPDEIGEIVELLQPLRDWSPEQTSPVGGDALSRLQGERDALRTIYYQMREELGAVRTFSSDQNGYVQQAGDQVGRLQSIELLPQETRDRSICPICSQFIEGDLPTANQIRSSLEDLGGQLEHVNRESPRLLTRINQLENTLEETHQQLLENRDSINAITASQTVDAGQIQLENSRVKTVGRISLFLESVDLTAEESELVKSREEALGIVQRLEHELDDDASDDILGSVLRIVSSDLGKWAEDLSLEHSGFPMEFDLNRLTVIAHTDNGPVPLANMGSAENWLGYHLSLHFALHKWFIQQERPVPGFLILDQPTQVYYPSDVEVDPSLDDISESDRESVSKLYRKIFQEVEELTPGLQLIVTDHADLNEEWFQDAVVERWRGERKLVPLNWIDEES